MTVNIGVDAMIKAKIIMSGMMGIALSVISPAITGADETIYPTYYDIQAEYFVSSYEISAGDTLIITRSVTNNENFGLANLYLADNFPLEFQLIDYSILIDGLAVPASYSGSMPDNELQSYNAYNWFIDLPPPDDSLNRILTPGESLTLQYRFNCQEPGEYSLPFHTFCAYGNNSGVFSIAPPISVVILPPVAIENNEPDIPENVYVSRTYPNPFNREVVISCGGSAQSGASIHLAIYDLTGGLVYDDLFADEGKISWRPADNVASGIYFYVISPPLNRQIAFGKVTLLK